MVFFLKTQDNKFAILLPFKQVFNSFNDFFPLHKNLPYVFSILLKINSKNSFESHCLSFLQSVLNQLSNNLFFSVVQQISVSLQLK